ncbi:MAG: hypothetical protein K2O70_00410 [Desulfovibrionaceae bacterium]|nr:hypothetical protein [Desulfovibrionaceae bacterium]
MIDFITPVNMAEVQYTSHVGRLAAEGVENARPLDPLAAVRNQTLQPALRPEEVLINEMTSRGNGVVINTLA